MTESAGPDEDQLALGGRPELAFRVTRPVAAGGAVSCFMPAGPWLNGPSGRPLAGALGILVDNVLGSAIMLPRLPSQWSVSAEISVDLCGPMPTGAQLLSAAARNDHADSIGGIASGSVTDSSGRLLALCRQHGRWVKPRASGEPWAPGRPPSVGPAAPAPRVPPSISVMLGRPAVAADGNARLDLAAAGELCNPLGNLHGGIILCACDLVAQAALDAVGGPARTTSIHVTYPRPVPAGAAARFEGRVLHRGRSLAITQVIASNDSGKPCAIGTVATGAAA